MRRVIIQIFCLYFSIFYIVTGAILHQVPLGPYLILAGFLNLIVAVKFMKFRSRTNMFYNSMFLYLSFLVNYFMIHNFLRINQDPMSQYLFRTLPLVVKNGFLLLNLGIVFLALMEFVNSNILD
ncbi:hypothetical protein ABB02_01843 [Clostridiaceae bacterium JG1575]|nr:hypothetical protein ABB02_01843 [Clostridiaceae bacterium JG1575]